jgi:hypothetical protein
MCYQELAETLASWFVKSEQLGNKYREKIVYHAGTLIAKQQQQLSR